ncbi:MAG: hypothetical protein LBS76_03400 [Mycoplasmataceae bacterium]|nr:hypothetical protein [Mycoplasmataceae bacterium]
MANQQPETKENLSRQQTEMLKNIDFSSIPSSDEFQKIKVKPQNRWFNSVMALSIVTIGICLGVIVGVLVAHFA